MPRVSIVMTAYNHEKLVGAAIASVLNQTYTDFEFFVADDASTDGTANIIDQYKDPRLKFFRYVKNTSAESGMDMLEKVTGEYIAIINSDDEWYPDKLAKQVDYLDKNKLCAAVFTLVTVTDENKNIVTNHPYYHVFRRDNRSRFDWLNHFFFTGNCVCHPSVLMRKEHYDDVGPYDIRIWQVPDYDLWMKMCIKYDIHIIQEPLIYFKLHPDNVSALTEDAKHRVPFEMSKLLTNYIKIQTVDDLKKIFPKIDRFGYKLYDSVIPFYVALEALDTPYVTYHYFGLNTIYDLLGDPMAVETLTNILGFGRPQFIALTAKYQVFPFTGQRIV